MQPLSAPPRVPWANIQAQLAANWKPGEHITLIGPTGSGKTHMALTLAEMCRYSLIISTKRKDPLLDQMRNTHLVTEDLSRDVLWTQHGTPLHTRIMFWPQFPEKMSTQQRLARQAAMIRKAIDWSDRTGGWCVVADELMWLTRNLRLEKEIEAVYFQGRTQGVSLLGCAQRPSHVPLLAFSQATYLFLWQSSDKRDLERLREVGAGFPKGMIDEAVRQLDWHRHEVLFVNAKSKELARTIAPARIGSAKQMQQV